MTKAQREKAERELLKKMIKDNPKLKDFLVSATSDKTNHSDLKSLIEPVLADTFEKNPYAGDSDWLVFPCGKVCG